MGGEEIVTNSTIRGVNAEQTFQEEMQKTIVQICKKIRPQDEKRTSEIRDLKTTK